MMVTWFGYVVRFESRLIKSAIAILPFEIERKMNLIALGFI